MRATIVWIAVAGCGGATATSINTGDPVPRQAKEPASCQPADGGYRWLGADPHVPLAITGDQAIAGAGGECCAAWGREGERWTAVDAWGAPVGERTVVGGEGYDVTQCYELYLEGDGAPDAETVPSFGTGAAAAVAPILVRGERAWNAPASARWEPTEAERASLLEFAASVDRVSAASMAADAPPSAEYAAPPLEQRVVYFTLPGDDRDDRVLTRFAAIGGRALVIAGLDGAGTWRTQYLDPTWGLSAGPWLDDAYRVLAVFDLDGDGFAEVVVHRSDGPSWDDAVLRCEHDSTLRPWTVVAESIGGSTA